eukprot:TRINITY_DN3030_c4_g5_i1.p1 TRINITY_DN3030_c4_g5~~TRINITY_DN3030_c4_g5_i1.p1  ORF type:complete len:421 (-),score=88.40 TRINITY_DN3030_c4_g5_i1:337-1566(-)
MSVESNDELWEKTIYDMLPLRIDESSMKEIRNVLNEWVYDCKYSIDDRQLVITGGSDGSVHVIDAETKELQRSLTNHSRQVFGIAFSPNGQMLATCSEDNFIIIYKLPDFSILNGLCNGDTEETDIHVYSICFSQCSNYIVAADGDGRLKKWNVYNGEVILESRVHVHVIWKVQLSPDFQNLLTCSWDNTAKLINSDDFSVIRTFNQDDYVKAIEFHPTQRIVAVCDRKKVHLYNMDIGSLLHTFVVEGYVFSIHFLSHDILLIMSGDGYIHSFNINSFQQIQKVYCGCDTHWFSFNISPDKIQLACGRCANNTIRFFAITRCYDSSIQPQLIELSKDRGYVLSKLIAMNMDMAIVRKLVSAGICMNEEEYNMIVDTCWELVDLNEANGGNMYSFMNEPHEESDDGQQN